MENAVNIMAIVQSSNMVKKKFDVPSKALGNDKTNFRKEFNQARKDIKNDYSIDNKDVEARTQSTTENRVEKFAKAMSNNNVKSEIKTKAEEKSSVEALEHTDVKEVKPNTAISDDKKLDIETENASIEELLQPMVDMLQQLIQVLEGQPVEGSSNQQLAALKTKMQEVMQMLEQAMEMPGTSQMVEINKLFTSMKNEMTEIVKQLDMVPENELDSKQSIQLMNQLSDKLNQAKQQLKEDHQMLHHALKTKHNSEAANMLLEQALKVGGKESIESGAVQVAEETDENKQIQKTDNGKTSDTKDEDNDNEESYKKNEVKHTASGDKLNLAADNKVVAPQVEKENFQLNIKQANVNLQKDSQVKVSTSDIMNQVIKKADIFVQGSHQEMIMKLEPESLGKLNLKIVLENGLITAKFIAESQQVKAVLESNFNQLKDALQEKGITVQNLSVSVGQQGAEFKSGQDAQQWKRTIKLNSKMSGEYMGFDEENSNNINPYSYHDGKVDYRA